MYRFEIDDAGVLKVETSGFWDVPTARGYLSEMKRYLTNVRDRWGYSLVLVDGRESQIQPKEVMDEFENLESLLISTRGDRAAYIVANSLAKMQAQRLTASERLKVFLSPTAARTWLTAYEVGDRR
ncbi:hypothetical protein J3E64_002053 [Sphingobium sp. OAS761]|uniref:hypothetical protein n=1 Tax=Sphingobium sp. OAS761 TaxID=2817901 RepID=UPI0020A15EF7|nr:hypothetical protein [Sphingobium sp. OAS761]MCP1470365.1 hypothetical protein [Sphingobium sp. OAS761]